MSSSPSTISPPTFLTVGIATWNRAALLRQTLESLTSLRVPEGIEWELLVCENNCTDDTAAVIESFAARLPVRRLVETRQGVSSARNRVVREARGQWVLFTDDDVLVDAEWMAQYLTGMARFPRAAVFGGSVGPWLPRKPTGRGAFLLREYPFVLGVLAFDHDLPLSPTGERVLFGANMALRRDVLPAEPFDPRLGIWGRKRAAAEDVEVARRIMKAGHEGWLLAGAKVRHYIDADHLTLRFYCRWQMGVGRTLWMHRGHAPRGRFGIRTWLWKRVLINGLKALVLWRPWPTKPFYHAVREFSRELGYVLDQD